MPPERQSRSGRRPSRAERREQLLTAAVAAIREHGPGVSMEQLAGAGGVTKPILYRHFGDRDGLITAIGEKYAERLTSRIATTLTTDGDPREILRGTVDAYLTFLEEEPELYSFLIGQALGARGGGDQVSALVQNVGRQAAVVIGDQLRALGLDAGGAEPWAFGIVGMVHQAGDWWIRARTMLRDALVDYLTTLLWHGFQGLGAVVGLDTDQLTLPAPTLLGVPDVVPINTALRRSREELLERHLAAHNAGDFDAVIATFATPRLEMIASSRVLDGAEAIRHMLHERRRSFPDQRFEVIALHHADDAVIVECWMTGTHLGELHGVEPTGKRFRARMASVFLFDGADLVAQRIYYDAGTIARQLA